MVNSNIVNNFYRAKASDFSKIPGSPIAYWVSEKIQNVFNIKDTFGSKFSIKAGMCTGKNETFILLWHEVQNNLIRNETGKDFVYTPHNKGGEFRKWCGNWDSVLKYSKHHLVEMESNAGFRHDGRDFYFREQIGWSKITSSKSSFRYYPKGFTFDSAGLALFSNDKRNLSDAILFLNSNICSYLILLLNPTLNLTPQILKKMPFINIKNSNLDENLYNNTKQDWDSYETSWDFKTLPIIATKTEQTLLLASTYKILYKHWITVTAEMQQLEEENNRIFIEAYGLQDELAPEVPINEITLTCNPYHRYGNNKSDHELEKFLLADTMKELISYAVGCSFGRYSLDKDGLILANAGEGVEDYKKQIPEPTFMPDISGILPITDENDFPDDLPNQFTTFLKASFGTENYSENLRFVEEVIGKDLRSYFIKDFYKDHVKRYKKRPIYWMISSPSGAFRTLIYLHRYTKDTISLFLNDYLRPYQRKLEAKVQQADQILISASSSNSDKTKAQKDLDKIRKVLNELEVWERDVVYPLATQRIELDLDDGVKVNYGKLGSILEKVKGLNG